MDVAPLSHRPAGARNKLIAVFDIVEHIACAGATDSHSFGGVADPGFGSSLVAALRRGV